ncbi:uncharacterized protein LOC134709210 [Mytilus trossulus]|uniref:uncharacterized protein LOC134709210 n=1 Tax=Mytilus trossulus TaxID=6551 RepID=UPI003004B5F8
MTFSNSLCHGQTPMLCQLCEESNEIKWKCLQCDFLLCTKCQRIHNKVKSTDQHTIIDIKDIASKQQEAKDNTDFSAIKEEKAARKQTRELHQSIPGKIGEALCGDDDYACEQYGAKVIKQYKTGLILVERVVSGNTGTFWISYTKDKIIKKIQLSNEMLNIVQEIHINCYGMALLQSGDLLISSAESNLKILSHTTGKIINSKYSVKPLITGGVHLIRNEKIVISARKEGPVFPVKGPRQIVLMDIDGKIEKVYDLDNNGKPIFFAPQRITTDTDNNIYVLDTFNTEWNGRIVALDKTNIVRWIYSGIPDVIKDKTFNPRDLISTQLNNIIITDMDSYMIHILNTSGQCIHYMNTKDQLGIVLPYSVDIDNTGTLHIGCNTSKQNKTNLYIVQFSGF